MGAEGNKPIFIKYAVLVRDSVVGLLYSGNRMAGNVEYAETAGVIRSRYVTPSLRKNKGLELSTSCGKASMTRPIQEVDGAAQ